jgi:hypothetical protein
MILKGGGDGEFGDETDRLIGDLVGLARMDADADAEECSCSLPECRSCNFTQLSRVSV